MKNKYTPFTTYPWYFILIFILFSCIGSLQAQTTTYTANDTFTAPHNTTTVTVECWGAGGRGGTTASNGTETGGGGGGAYARKNAQAVTPNSNYTIVVGTGSTSAAAGGDSYFNSTSTVMAKGGNSVANNTAGGATGGSAGASVGDVKFSGGSGANGSNGNNGGGGGSSAGTAAAGNNGSGATGGTAPTGGGNGGNGRSGSNGNGTAGSTPGGGGGGVLSGNTNSRTGGAGADGQVTVSWTCSNVLTSATGTNNQTICLGAPIVSITYTCSGAYGATFTGLPTGVTGTYTNGAIVISGTPTVTGTFSYTVTPTGSCTSSIVTGQIKINTATTGVTASASAASICNGSSVDLSATANSNLYSTPITVFTENFNAATNSWVLTNTGTGGTPALANWTLRSNGYVVSSETFNSNDASQFYMSNSDAQGSGSTTATILRSPAFSTVGMSSANLSFYHYYRYNGTETGVVQISTDGSAWTTLSGPYTATQGSSTNFSLVTLNINAYINQPTVYVRFKYDATWDWYWAVDNVQVSGFSNVPDECTYSWTSSPSGFTSSVKNPTGVTPSVTTTYTVVATNSAGCSSSASTTVTVNNYVTASVSIAASATTICAGTSVTFTATPTNGGTTPSYQWKVNGNNVGTNSATYTSTTLNNSDVVTVVMTSNATPCVNGTPATSNSITMTVNPSLPASVSIAASATTICAGTSVTFTATPTNGGTTPSYQWKVNGNNVGTNSATYTSTTLNNNDAVTVVMTSNASPCLTGSPATSNTITMTVNSYLPVSVSIAASATTICAGTSVTFTATPTNGGATPTYQWKVNGNNVGNNSATYTSTTLNNNDAVTVVMTSNASPCLTGSPATSNTITMTVNPNVPASVSIAASATTICAGTSVTFTATPTNGGTTPSYQWKVNGNNVGTDNALYTTTSLQEGDVVTVVMTASATLCGTGSPATSNAITMTVNPLALASITATNGPSQCYGNDVTFTVSGTTNAIVYYNLNGGGTQFTVLTGGSAIITVPGALTSQTLNLVSVDNGQCPVTLTETATVTIATTTWDGTAWSNGMPDASKAVFITGNLTLSSDITACSIAISNNAVVTVSSGTNVTLQNAIQVASGSSFTLNSNANLIQVNPNAVNTGAIVVKRTTNPLIRLDYTLWGSPVAGQNLFNFSPLTTVTPSIRFYTYTSSINFYNSVTDYATHTMQTGKGYLIRLPFNHPTAPAVWTGSFTGVPNNGSHTVSLSNGGTGLRYNAISNPYPSTLDIASFYAENASNVEPTLYFWRKTNNATKPSYCTWNMDTDTFVDNNEAFTESPNGIIQVGQGFFVEAKGAATSVVFNNTQRVGNTANQFFRSATTEKHRIWLNITSGNDFAQAVVGYFSNGSLDADATDSKLFNDGNLMLSAPIAGTNYIVNGRPVPFNTADVVPMTYKATTAGTLTMAIDHVDGLFTGGAQDIYIHDLTTDTYHNLNQAPYVFQTQAGTFTNRFELVYQNALGNGSFTTATDALLAYTAPQQLHVQMAKSTIQEVRVFDLKGRLLLNVSKLNAQQVQLPFTAAQQTLIVVVKTTEGQYATKKIN